MWHETKENGTEMKWKADVVSVRGKDGLEESVKEELIVYLVRKFLSVLFLQM